jgi:hypothetical protein
VREDVAYQQESYNATRTPKLILRTEGKACTAQQLDVGFHVKNKGESEKTSDFG